MKESEEGEYFNAQKYELKYNLIIALTIFKAHSTKRIVKC